MFARRAVCTALMLLGLGAGAPAEVYPARPVTIVVPYPPGAATDALARILGDRMRLSLGQPVIIENVSGAGGSVGAGRVARASADGYTLVIGHWQTHVTNGATQALKYDVLADFKPISLLTHTPQWIVARNGLPANDLKELIEWLKGNPDRATAGTVGVGDPAQIAGVFFATRTGTSFRFVPYRGGGPMYQDLLAGNIDLVFGQVASTLMQVHAGQLKAYAVMAKNRWPAARDVPTIDEAGVQGLHASFWYGMWAPKGTPDDVVAKINAAVRDALADEGVRQRLVNLGQEIFPLERQTPEALATYQKGEIEKWWPIIKAAGIKSE